MAIRRLGSRSVRDEFPEYAQLMSHLVVVRRKVAGARKDVNGRHDLYEELETGELPKIVALFEQFKIVEPLMKNKKFRNFMRDQGLTIGGMLALFVGYLALK